MAKQQLFQALNLNSDSTLLNLIYMNLSKVYEREQTIDSAIYFAKLSAYFSEKQNNIHILSVNYKILARLEKNNNNCTRALDYIQQHLKYYTQIKEENIFDIQKIETKYKFEALQKEKYIMRRWYTGTLLCLCFAAIVIVCFIRKKNAKLAETQNKMNEMEKSANTELSEIKDTLTNIMAELNEKSEFSNLTWNILQEIYKNIDVLDSDIKFIKILDNKEKQINEVVIHLKSIFYKNYKWDAIYNAKKSVFAQIKNLYPELTEMEFKIVCLEYLDYSNSMIASIIGLNDKHTVSRNKSHIREKLRIENRGNIASFINTKLEFESKKSKL
jgi:hypothetical protein